MIKFQSQLADKIVLFLEFKHSMGIIYKTGEVTLYDFDRYNLDLSRHIDISDFKKNTINNFIKCFFRHHYFIMMIYIDMVN